jgi:hypothetical protein
LISVVEKDLCVGSRELAWLWLATRFRHVKNGSGRLSNASVHLCCSCCRAYSRHKPCARAQGGKVRWCAVRALGGLILSVRVWAQSRTAEPTSRLCRSPPEGCQARPHGPTCHRLEHPRQAHHRGRSVTLLAAAAVRPVLDFFLPLQQRHARTAPPRFLEKVLSKGICPLPGPGAVHGFTPCHLRFFP